MVRANGFATRALLLSCVVAIAACGANGTDSPKQPLNAATDGSTGMNGATSGPPVDQLPPGMTPLAAAHLDSANVAFRARQYDQAMGFYRKAALDVPEHAAPWYGIYMVAQATKNTALADSATSAIATRTGGQDLLKNGMADNHKGSETPSGLPSDHPAVKPGQTSKVPVPQ
jgi:hypothetical protein